MDYEVGQRFVGGYPPELAAWCDANSCELVPEGEEGGEPVYVVREWEPVVVVAPPDPAPSREELAAAVAELGDMLAEERQRNDELSAALLEIGDMMAVMAAGEEA